MFISLVKIDYMAECIPLVYDVVNLSEDERMAKKFCLEAKEYFSGINGKIYAIPSLRKGREMDLVIWMHFDKFKPLINTGYIENPNQQESKEYKRRIDRDVWFNSALIILELKKHNTSDSLSIREGKLFVKYHDKWSNASAQSFDQIFHLRNFLGERLNIPNTLVPKIQNFIWLNRCFDRPSESDELDNIIYGEIDFKNLLQSICRLNSPVSYDGENILFESCKEDVIGQMDDYIDQLRKEKSNGLGIITRNKLSNIIKKEIDIASNRKAESIGEMFTLIKGKPGTGKTIHLIHLAYHLSQQEYKPVILTYNKALVRDIDRMIYYSGYEGALEIKTIHSFFHHIFCFYNLIEDESDYNYEITLHLLFDEIKEEENQFIQEILNIKYDTLLIDEAQDCSEIEKSLLIKIFDQKNIVASIGSRQIVRKSEISWTQNITRKNINLINLTTTYRNKKNLVEFFNSFSERHYEVKPWNLKQNRLLHGGKLQILNSSEYNIEFHSNRVDELIDNGNSRYDLMFLTPSKSSSKNYAHELNEMLNSWEYYSFDDTTVENKSKRFPIDRHRILNYQSCRGLEAWVLVCWNMDEIIKNIRTYYNEETSENIELHVNNWLLMIFTRAIDTLIITFQDISSPEAKLIINLAKSQNFGHMSELQLDS